MKIWALKKHPPATEDAAYLLGHLASYFPQIAVSHVNETDDKLPSPPDSFGAVFNYSFHAGSNYLTALDALAAAHGVPVINPGNATYRACDKRSYVDDFSAMAPSTWVARSLEQVTKIQQDVGGELVLKPPFGKHGIDIMRFRGEEDSTAALALLSKSPDHGIVVQVFCNGFTEGDKRVIVHRNADGVFEITAWFARVPPPGGWITNYRIGGQILPCDLIEDERQLALEVAEIAALDYVGIDLARHEGRCLLIETNAYTGGHINFDTDRRANSGDDFAQMVLRIAEMGRA